MCDGGESWQAMLLLLSCATHLADAAGERARSLLQTEQLRMSYCQSSPMGCLVFVVSHQLAKSSCPVVPLQALPANAAVGPASDALLSS